MRKLLLMGVAAYILFPSGHLNGAQGDNSEKQQIKARHKDESRALKLQQHYRKESLKGQALPKAERKRVKREMKRAERELRERQKDELEDLKGRQQLLKETQELL